MNKITTTTAVLLALRSIGDDIFSVYNVTQKIRDELAAETYELDSGKIIFHEEVKDAFSELMENVYASEYVMRYSTRGYREFQRASAAGVANTPVVPASTISNTKITQTPVSPANITILSQIIAYTAGTPRTTKQIQSRFKDCGLTCKQIKDLLEAQNMLDNSTKNFPASKVMTK